MKTSITKIDLRHLENGTHFEFMTTCSTFFAAKSYENELVNNTLKTFNEALKAEDEQLKIFISNEEVKNVTANDQLRDNCYTYLRACVKAHANALASPVREVAEKILATIDKYNLRISVGIDKETGLLRNIIDDLKKDGSFTEALTTMGMKPVFDEMERTNQAVAQAQDARDRLNEQRIVGGMAEARRATDEAYGNLCFILESAAAMFGAPFKTDIPSWNSTVNRYKANLEHKQAVNAAKRKEEEADKPKPEPQPEGGNQPKPEPQPQPEGGNSQTEGGHADVPPTEVHPE